jgi:18S rRNA (adenine1779-N6/adenine1780-N6)-dimethyltransferase
MPKVARQKRNNASQGLSDAAAKTKAAHSIFKMNTDIGQHVLKNPGIAGKLLFIYSISFIAKIGCIAAIVEKAELKQSDVSSRGD